MHSSSDRDQDRLRIRRPDYPYPLFALLRLLSCHQKGLCLSWVAGHHRLFLRRVWKNHDLDPILYLHLAHHRLDVLCQNTCPRALVPCSRGSSNKNLPRRRDEMVGSLDGLGSESDVFHDRLLCRRVDRREKTRGELVIPNLKDYELPLLTV